MPPRPRRDPTLIAWAAVLGLVLTSCIALITWAILTHHP